MEVALEEDDSHTISKVDEADINLAIDGFLESAQEGQLGQRTEEGSSGHLPEKPKRSPRSLIWRHFERSDSSGSARCRICKKELQFFDGSTSNLHRHMLKKHPGLSLRAGNMLKPPSSNPPSGLNDNSDNLVSVGLTDQSEFSGKLLHNSVPFIYTCITCSSATESIIYVWIYLCLRNMPEVFFHEGLSTVT